MGLLLATFIVLFSIVCSSSTYVEVAKAIAVIQGPYIHGYLTLTQSCDCGPLIVEGIIYGLKPGEHGIHVHQYGDIRDIQKKSVGGHYNPGCSHHGGIHGGHRHLGDWGNIVADSYGTAKVYIKDCNLSIICGCKCNILGRSIAIHANRDDEGKGNHPESKINGYSGPIVAAGVIGLKNREF